jgi:DNA polymerase-3 subunit chi
VGDVFFYHLTRRPLEVTLRVLLEKSLSVGWRVAVRGRSDAMLDRLDQQLWLHPEDGFLPHGRAGGAHDADQPVLLTTGAAGNAPNCVISVEGAALSPDDIAVMTRAMVLFEDHDPAAVQTAREQWKALTAGGARAQYWSEESGKWQMKAQSGQREAD